VARLVGLSVPSVATSAAGVVSFFLAINGLRYEGVVAMCVMWGVVGVVSVAAVLTSALMARGARRPAGSPPALKTYQTDSAAAAGPPHSRNIMLPDQYP
jgi:hypothetical protein